MPEQEKENIVSLGINYSDVLKQALDTPNQEKTPNISLKKEEAEGTDIEGDFMGMLSLF